jgi:hypothetical protein
MKLNWHQKAARVAAMHPHWPWEKVCAEVGRRKPRKIVAPKQPTPQQYSAELEKRGLF